MNPSAISLLLACLVFSCYSGVASSALNSAPAGKKLPTAEELKEQSAEMGRLAEAIDKSSALYSKGPKRRFITASVQQAEYRTYLDAWTKKIERVGNEHYPEEAHRLGLSGRVIVTVSIARDGTLLEAKVERSSGSIILDDAAVAISKLASPFEPIPTVDGVDILDITRTWDFRNDRTGM